jgi:aminopeptidase 2
MREAYNPFIRDSSPEDSDQLLPTNVKPTHYDIQLEPDLEKASFAGSVTVHLDVLKESHSIVLNAVGLDILSTEIIETSGNVTKIPKVQYHAVQQTMAVPLPEAIPAGSRIKLRQTFNGIVNESKKNSGLMRSKSKGFDGKTKWMASTQGQPTGIREIFPCADEPGLKATFTATMIVDQGLTCLSNMDIASEEAYNEQKKTVVFNKTPLMSTYLMAFVVGELNYIESTDYRVPVRVYAAPDQDIKDGKFALMTGVQAMISHEKTFGSPYPLPKLDQVAVPGHSGAMENWGCVIYSENYLIQDDDDASAYDTERVAMVVIHELAHQWFGNIVTTQWWDSTWLNESFADWATYNAMLKIFPDWDMWKNFVAGHPGGWENRYQAALTLDSNRGSHPIEVPVSTPEQISQIFDAITYAKGCSILRMISEYLGVEVFIEGVRLHLQRHAFGNATTNELWDSLSAVSGKDVQKIMSIWTQKVGYPILTVTEDVSSNTVVISQHRFLQSGKISSEDDQTLYPIYLKTKSKKGIDQEAQLFDRKGKFPVDLKFYKLNAGQTGLYRVSYPLSRWETFGQQLSSSLLSADDRVGLISDLAAIVRSGQYKARTSNFLSFLSNFKDEKDYFVWRQILVSFQDIQQAWLFEDTATKDALTAFQKELMKPILDDFDHDLWNPRPWDTQQQISMKAVLFANAASYEPVKIISTYLFKKFIAGDHKAINANIRKAVFTNILSDEKATEKQVTSPFHINQICESLTTFRIVRLHPLNVPYKPQHIRPRRRPLLARQRALSLSRKSHHRPRPIPRNPIFPRSQHYLQDSSHSSPWCRRIMEMDEEELEKHRE